MKKFRSKESKIKSFSRILNFLEPRKASNYTVLTSDSETNSIFSIMDNRSRKRAFMTKGYPLGAQKAKIWVMRKRHIYNTPKRYLEPDSPNTERPCLFFLNYNGQFLHFYDLYERMHLNAFTIRLEQGLLAKILDYKIHFGNLYVLTDASITIFKMSDFTIVKQVNIIDEVLAVYHIGCDRLLLVPKSGNLLEIYDLERD